MHFLKKKSLKSLSVQKLLVPLQPKISKVVFAQMAESVDALVSNTSGAIHPGSIPGLGTIQDKEVVVNQKVTLLPFFFGATLVQHIRKKISFPHFWGIFLILNFSISAEK